MAKARFCLIIDTEADFWRFIPSPHFSKVEVVKWYLNKLFRGYRFAKGRQGIFNLVRLLKTNKIPTTFTIVGHLYLKSCNGFPHFKEELPKATWMKNLIGKKWDYWEPKSDYKQHSGVYCGDFIEKEMKVPYFDLGLHAFSHEAITLESKNVVYSIIKAAVEAAESIGVSPKSFGAPFNMIEDIRDNKKVYKALKKNGIKNIRFAGKEKGLNQMHQNAVRKPFKRHGLNVVQASRYFEGNSPKRLIKTILKEIDSIVGKDVVYCLNTHDFTHKNTKNLKIILKRVLQLEIQGKIKMINMRNLK